MSLLGPGVPPWGEHLPRREKGDVVTIVDRTGDGPPVEHHALVTHVERDAEGNDVLTLLPDPTEPMPFEGRRPTPD